MKLKLLKLLKPRKPKLPKFMQKLLTPFKKVYEFSEGKIQQSIRVQLIMTFVICLLSSYIVFSISNHWLMVERPYIDYTRGMEQIDQAAGKILHDIKEADPTLSNKVVIEQMVSNENGHSQISNQKVFIVDLDGKVLFKSKYVAETQIDLQKLMEFKYGRNIGFNNREEAYIGIYPLFNETNKFFLVVEGMPTAYLAYSKESSPLGILLAVITFISLFYLLTLRKMRHIEELAGGVLEISKGNLDFRVSQKSQDELGSLAGNINHMAAELKLKIEEERRAERTKNELITNFSHDLRTPLTSILGYLNLIKDGKYETDEQFNDYVNIVYNKSEKLGGLIADLFQYTKLTNKGVRLTLETVSLNELLEQLLEEHTPSFEENNLTIIKEIPQEKIYVDIDVNQTVRVFENLLLNAVKYSYKPGEIIVKLSKEDNDVLVIIQNKGEHIPQSELARLFDRFYRVEQSRTADKGGSGLGLAIAKGIVELQGGQIWAECSGEVIRFIVKLK
ncbi:sensor histidine kinase [Desulfosporosinus sp. I2]|uniref:sensor histidine kinase n=1 Tax=Desulfosporosinus sp. I2 TaxID=1617025 RepID=UPI00061F00AB|nr:ATP-binding protein [Desulfosporosinus sp. I2]KJR46722.1 sensor histidine kinase [Desulfosporosinus sp. I2]